MGVVHVTDQEVVAKALARWGRVDPTPDEVLLERWPRYHVDRIHTAGYHRFADAIADEMRAREMAGLCRVCGGEIPSNAALTRKFCSKRCKKRLQLEKGRKRPRVTRAEAADIAKRYLADESLSVAELARRLGRHSMTVSKVLRQAGIPIRTNNCQETT